MGNNVEQYFGYVHRIWRTGDFRGYYLQGRRGFSIQTTRAADML